MADNELRPLTEAETQALAKEYPKFVELAVQQTKEQIVHLKKHIGRDPKIDEGKRAALLQILDNNGFKLLLYRISDANVLQKHHVQIAYDVHDDLWDYLQGAQSELPRELRGFFNGGTLIDPKTQKPMMTDLMPLTGKTRTGVPKYDAILEARERGGKI